MKRIACGIGLLVVLAGCGVDTPAQPAGSETEDFVAYTNDRDGEVLVTFEAAKARWSVSASGPALRHAQLILHAGPRCRTTRSVHAGSAEHPLVMHEEPLRGLTPCFVSGPQRIEFVRWRPLGGGPTFHELPTLPTPPESEFPPPLPGDPVVNLRARCATNPCEASAAIDFVWSMVPALCATQIDIPCGKHRVLNAAIKAMYRCPRGQQHAGLERRLAADLLDRTIAVLGDLEDRYAGTASCADDDEKCLNEHSEAGMLGPPEFDHYC